jgi:triphosphoribosyl-dephospho-CoA synthase
MTAESTRSGQTVASGPCSSPGRLAQAACLLEVIARKPGNVHRYADLPGLRFVDFLLSAMAIAEPLDRAATEGVGSAVLGAIEATRRVVSTNTNLGIVLLLAPLAAVRRTGDLAEGIKDVLAMTTVDDAQQVYRAIRLAQPGGLGEVADQDVAREPTIPLTAVMGMAAERDSIARQYANGFREVLGEGLPALRDLLHAGSPLETAIITCHLQLLARHPDSLIIRKYGLDRSQEVSHRAAELIDTGWPNCNDANLRLESFDSWLRHPDNRLNPGTTADLVTAALYLALRDGTIAYPLSDGSFHPHR